VTGRTFWEKSRLRVSHQLSRRCHSGGCAWQWRIACKKEKSISEVARNGFGLDLWTYGI